MPLPLQELAMETTNVDLVRLTLAENGAGPTLVESLIPVRPLVRGEQYRFHFDMTKCIGCRSCEIACNEQNGNPAGIQWRRVGELEGGTYPHTQRTYLSMGCNHCLSADCLRGCPVDAYTKDPLTGIVLHSAEACIGCQYCVWNCPYSVPQFNPERGVVGKCDMCRSRLQDGREPACVDACPENAIQIEIVNKEEWRGNYHSAESPGMPPAGQTISTTRITLPSSSRTWLERVDTGSIGLEHSHPSLIAMTLTMQAAVGALAVLCAIHELTEGTLVLLVALTSAALSISVLHLGRPAYAWRALKMWRRSWLSREVMLFSLFYTAIVFATTTACIDSLHAFTSPMAWAAVALGVSGTLASAFVYLVRSRPSWNMLHTPLDFLLSCGLLGSAITNVVGRPAAFAECLLSADSVHMATTVTHPVRLISVCSLLWCMNHITKTLRLRRATLFELRTSYNLLRGESLSWKFALSLLSAAATAVFSATTLPWLAVIAAVAAVAIGRYLFFVSVVPLNMGLTFLAKQTSLGAPA